MKSEDTKNPASRRFPLYRRLWRSEFPASQSSHC
jgi:hypothetical protein